MDKDGDGFPDPEECLKIFGGSDAIYSKRQHKVRYREAADRVGKQPQQGQPDHFNKLIESPCTNHAYPIKHLYKDCELLKRFLR